MAKEKIPLVSVIIPMYNSAKFIPQTLESLLYQTMKDFEVVVVDDCSTDNSIEVVESFIPKFKSINKANAIEESLLFSLDSGELEVIAATDFSLADDFEFLEKDSQEQGIRLNIIKMPEHTGTPGLPRNVGIESARGKYIAFLDSDDLFTETALEELSTLAEKYQADVVSIDGSYRLYRGRRRSIDDPSMTDMNELTNPKNFMTLRFFNDKSLTEPTLKPENFAERLELFFLSSTHNYGIFSSFCKRDFLSANQINFKNIPAGEDQVFNFTCLCTAEKFLRVPNIYYIVRPRDNSIMREKIYNPLGYFSKRVRAFKYAFDEVERLMSQIPFFKEHPDYRYSVFEKFAFFRLAATTTFYADKTPFELHELVKREFSSDVPTDAAFTAYLFDTVNVQRLQIKDLKTANKKLQDKLPC